MTLTSEELKAIEERNKRAPGRWHSDSCGAPVVHTGYAERLINMLPHTILYIRQKRGETWEGQMDRLVQLAHQLKPLFEPAYQAHRDVDVLLEEVKRLRLDKGTNNGK